VINEMRGEPGTGVTLSVIVPTYNRGDFVRSCVTSLLASGVPDIEAIVVDDGSPEDVESVVRSFGEPVRYVRQANAGPAAARNNGFGVSRGRYVTFLDSDDEWFPGVAPRLIAALDARPECGAIFTDTAMGSPETGYASFVRTYSADGLAGVASETVASGVRLLERRDFFRRESVRNVMFLGSLIFRREAVQRLGGFDPKLRGAADWELFMRLVLSEPLLFCGEVTLARYLKHEAGMSTEWDHMSEDFIGALSNVLDKCQLEPDQRRHLEGELKRHWFGWAYQAYDRGNLPVARERFARAARAGSLGPAGLAYWAASRLPRAWVQRLRVAKRAVSG
jgi:glycosyltransferase involved in cell wall biosynthesis